MPLMCKRQSFLFVAGAVRCALLPGSRLKPSAATSNLCNPAGPTKSNSRLASTNLSL
jgi:hypothetical protein